ncbi:hypothetical protein [Legionella longbeachae]|uniref:Uncharacterized protein n=1 Tax=Legionella longbeachae serogroup 1 (strain NSW150) TaxID=661367 RepID=D3HQD6_LEGLN|nr:hypothetical protein [Legionella longbeachae]VEE01622.1 coiled-coil protein [Legionella oakridgensis]HBD7396382.1 hypothetical protein [Legionella pneumophila]ARB92037.1 hypothetical protein A6J40_07525 [Legionella longbeachae]ARM34779.1 hypothetical protein B0B39_15195 [Legionella longbeachae]EEZ95787.1 hypothetical protein LLB_0968 [Legionella longbeachae D-4968]
MTIKWIPDNQIGEVQKDGSFTRAASYGVSMINAYFFDELSRLDTTNQEKNLLEIIEVESKLVPSLKALDIIGFFSPMEWLQCDNQGRIMIILLYFTQQPEAVTPEIVQQLKEKYTTLIPILQKMVDQILDRSTT